MHLSDDRRDFLKLLAAGMAAGTPLAASIGKALAIPAHNATGTVADVEHVVILMQKNRAFDHYLGTLSGVRGFGDPRAVTLSTGKSVFYQPGAMRASIISDLSLGRAVPMLASGEGAGYARAEA